MSFPIGIDINIEKYNSKCGECGSINIKKRLHRRYGISVKIEEWEFSFFPFRINCNDSDSVKIDRDHIHYYCNDCLFEWMGLTKYQAKELNRLSPLIVGE